MHRIESIQGYRAFLFLNIFLFHILGIIGIRENYMNGFFMGSGRFGVTGFILLTGALAINGKEKPYTQSISDSIREKTRKFFKKFYLWHVVFMVFALPFSIWALYLHQKTLERFLLEILSSVTLTQSIIPIENLATSLNDVAWYLSTYLFLLPIIVVVCFFSWKNDIDNPGTIFLILLSVYTAYIATAAIVETLSSNEFIKCWLLYYFFGLRAFEIMIGALIYRLSSSMNSKVCLALFFAGLILYLLIQCSFEVIPTWLSYSLVYIPSNCLLIATCFNGSLFVQKIWTNPVLTYMGDRSMYYFISHVILGKYLIRILSSSSIYRSVNSYLQNAISIVICLIATILAGEIMLRISKRFNYNKKTVHIFKG